MADNVDNAPDAVLFDANSGRAVPIPADSVTAAYNSGQYLIPLKDSDGNFKAVPPNEAANYIQQGFIQPSNTEILAHQANNDALAEAGQHPLENLATSFGAGLISRPGVAALGGPSLPEQNLLAEANPKTTILGNVAGGVTQAVGLGLATGGIGDVAEGAEAADLAPGLISKLGGVTGIARTFGINAAQGLTQGVNEQSLGDTGYNSEALAIDSGLAGVLGLGVESAFIGAKSIIPKVIPSAKSALNTLDDIVGTTLGKASSAVTGIPESDLDIPGAIAEARETGPLNKAAKLAAGKELRDTALDLADATNQAMDKVADFHDELWDNIRPKEIAVDTAPHDLNNGYLAAKTTTNNVISSAREGLKDVKAQLKPFLQDEEGNVSSYPASVKGAESALNSLDRTINTNKFKPATDYTSAKIYDAVREARQVATQGLKYGQKLNGIDEQAANLIRAKVVSPLQDLLGRSSDGIVTPESTAAFGQAAAERNAIVNKAYTNLVEAQKNLEPLLGTKFLENGRPETEISPAKIERLIKGEGLPGETPTNLSQLRAKNAFDKYLSAANEYIKVGEESANRAGIKTSSPKEIADSLTNVSNKRAAAQEQIGNALGPKMQNVANLTSLTGQGAGGLRGSIRNLGNGLSHTLEAGALFGHPVAGAIGGTLDLAGRAYTAAKYPVESINTYVNITNAAAKVAGLISSGIKKMLTPTDNPIVKNAASAGVTALLGSTGKMDEARKILFKDSKILSSLNQSPEGLVNTLAKNTEGLAQHAPQHANEVSMTAFRAQQVLNQYIPLNPMPPSPLGPEFDKWQPNDAQVLKYFQVKNAIFNPKSVIENFPKGFQTKDAWDAFKTVYPKSAELMSHKAFNLVADNQEYAKDMSMNQKTMFSMITGVPVDQALTSNGIQQQQMVFNTVPSNPTGTNLPNPKPRVSGLNKLSLNEDEKWPGTAPGSNNV